MKAGSKDWGKGWSQQDKGHRKYLFENIRNKKKAFNNIWSDIFHLEREDQELIHLEQGELFVHWFFGNTKQSEQILGFFLS